jgi:hypothetical protein
MSMHLSAGDFRRSENHFAREDVMWLQFHWFTGLVAGPLTARSRRSNGSDLARFSGGNWSNAAFNDFLWEHVHGRFRAVSLRAEAEWP